MQSLLHAKSVAEIIVHFVPSNTGFIAPITEVLGKVVNISFEDHRLRGIEEASTKTGCIVPFI